MLDIRWTVCVLGCLFATPALHAETIKIDGDNPRNRITVTIENAKVDQVLKDFGKTFGFEIKGLKNARQGDAFSVTMTGSLEDILGRLLRNWNHMIVRLPDNKSGIKKVMILNSTYGSLPRVKRNSAYGSSPPEIRKSRRHQKPSFFPQPKLSARRGG
ncbi:hypothetical protein MnTg02_00083 [bacterium MnTg02]|nr:hypothetical protein MnTg02_00083 [bacterium MnTg02]